MKLTETNLTWLHTAGAVICVLVLAAMLVSVIPKESKADPLDKVITVIDISGRTHVIAPMFGAACGVSIGSPGPHDSDYAASAVKLFEGRITLEEHVAELSAISGRQFSGEVLSKLRAYLDEVCPGLLPPPPLVGTYV
jgi:hypothetical protein